MVRQEDSALGPGDLALGGRDGVEPLGVAQLAGLDDEVPDQSADLEALGFQRNPRGLNIKFEVRSDIAYLGKEPQWG